MWQTILIEAQIKEGENGDVFRNENEIVNYKIFIEKQWNNHEGNKTFLFLFSILWCNQCHMLPY